MLLAPDTTLGCILVLIITVVMMGCLGLLALQGFLLGRHPSVPTFWVVAPVNFLFMLTGACNLVDPLEGYGGLYLPNVVVIGFLAAILIGIIFRMRDRR